MGGQTCPSPAGGEVAVLVAHWEVPTDSSPLLIRGEGGGRRVQDRKTLLW